MKIAYIFWTLAILFTKSNGQCQRNLNNCSQWQDDGNIKLSCGPMFGPRIDLTMDPQEKNIRIQCYLNEKTEMNNYFHILPKFNLNKVDWVGIYGCNTENTTITAILNHLCINNTLDLTIDGRYNRNAVTSNCVDNETLRNLKSLKFTRVSIKTNLFENMANLKSLDLNADEFHIDGDSLKNLENLQILILENFHKLFINGLPTTTLPNNIFDTLKNLQHLNLRKVPMQQILDNAGLDNLEKLQRLYMEECKIKAIARNIFTKNNNLTDLSMKFNSLRNLPENIFANTIKLTELSLSWNELEKLSPNLFKNQRELINLDLSHNKLEELPSDLFANLRKLRILKLNNNKISIIHFINLNHNFLSISSDISPFGLLTNLEELHLSHNNITDICMDWYATLLRLKTLDLSYNKIGLLRPLTIQFPKNANVDLRHNNISTIQFFSSDFTGENAGIAPKNTGKIFLSRNPIKCDCKFYSFYKAITQGIESNLMPQIEYEALYCNEPSNLKGIEISKLNPKDFICPMGDLSADNCAFEYRTYDNSIIMNCSNKNLNELPKVLPNDSIPTGFSIILYIDNNNLTSLDINFDKNSILTNVKEIYAFNNKISKINFTNSSIKSLKQLTLHQNPWDCHCGNKIVPFIQKSYVILHNLTQIECVQHFEKSILELIASDVCYQNQNKLDYKIIALGLIVICVVFIAIIFYLKYKLTTILWKHEKYQGILPSYTNANNSKLYDIFVIYSTKDIKYLTYELIPKLQSDRSIRLFLFCVDSEENVCNLKSIQNFIDTSHNTICILSDYFIEKIWDHCHQTSNMIFINTGEKSINNNYLKQFVNLKT
ncbi:protein toll-like [Chrysoperla carnea]|uniref:protein toll-like n=1 Tax=Chrysoperla carnea TaxID=189513 RepID=UPI001D05DBBC|nr:protein toll-like [Chrysoperla carnea]